MTIRSLTLSMALLCLICIKLPVCASEPQSGWDLLGDNNNNAARAAFSAALRQNPKDVDALNGLGRIEDMEDTGGEASRFMPAILLDPNNPQSIANWQLACSATETYDKWTTQAPLWTVLANDRAAPPFLRSSAMLAVAENDRLHGNMQDARAIWSKMHYIRAWNIIGPFENVSKSGFKKPFSPETLGIDLASSAKVKNGTNANWRKLALVTPDGDCNIGQALQDSKPSVYYAATTVDSSSDKQVLLWLNSCGATKIWINGTCVIKDDVYRDISWDDGDVFDIPVTLKKGSNVVLIKCADDDDCTSMFSVRFTDSDGVTPLVLTTEPDKAASIGIDLTDSSHIPTIDPASIAIVKAAPVTVENLVALASLQASYADNDDERDTLQKAVALAPHDGWVVWRYSRALSACGQDDEARTARQTAMSDNPNIVDAQTADLDDEGVNIAPDEKTARVKELVKEHPGSVFSLLFLASAYSNQSLTDLQIQTLEKAYHMVPSEEMASELLSACSDAQHIGEGQNAISSLLSRMPGAISVLDSDGDLLSSLGKTTEAVDVYRKEITYGASPVKPLQSIFSTYSDAHMPQLAISTMQELIKLMPQYADCKSKLADVYASIGDKTKATQFYNEAITLDPSQIDLRNKILSLNGEKPVIDLAPATPGQPLIAAQKEATSKTAAAVHVLLDEARQVIYPDGASDCRTHFIAKILDHSAISRYSQFEMDIPSDTAKGVVRSARLIKPDGKEMYSNYDSDSDSDIISFPSLDIGDIIDVDYDVTDYSPGALASNFWATWFFNEREADVDISRFALITPTGLDYKIVKHGNPPDPTVHTVGNWTITEWDAAKLPAVTPEPLAPPISDMQDWVDISNVGSWSDIVSWYIDLANSACTPDETIRAKAIELTQGDTTDEDKVKAIVKYVRAIRYQSTPFRLSAYVPTDGKQVIRERYGDCKDKAALICSLLNSLNIQAQMILLSPRDSGITPLLPSPRFDHAIARIKIGDGWQWVDATADQMQYETLPYQDQGVPTLVIADDTTGLSSSPVEQPAPQETNSTVNVVLSSSGDITGTATINSTGSRAWRFRSIMHTVGASDRDQVMQEIASLMVSGAIYDSGNIDGLDSPDAMVTATVTFHAPRFAASAGSLLIMKMPWSSQISEISTYLHSQKSRTEPIEVAELRGGGTTTLNIKLPAGYKPEDLEPTAKEDTAWGSYEFTYTSSGDTITIVRKVQMSQQRVPAKDAAGYEQFVQDCSDQDSKQIVLKKVD